MINKPLGFSEPELDVPEQNEKPIEVEKVQDGPQNKKAYVEKIEEKTVPFEQQSRPELHVVMAQDDAYIADRIKSQPKNLDEIVYIKESKFAPNEHRLSLPKELREYEDRFAFRWINNKRRAIDDAMDLKGWLFVNRVSFKTLPNRLFTSGGAIRRGDTVLMFMPLAKAEALRRAPGEKSSALIKAQLSKGEGELPKGQSGFYKPNEGTSESDSIPADAVYPDGKDINN